MRLATWNVNSLKVRLPALLEWLAANPVDVIGLQETKQTNEAFPAAELEAAGWHWAHNGQKTYNGVAILSRHPLAEVTPDITGFADEQKRVIAATITAPGEAPLRFVNAYIVNGQAVGSEKYAYKLRFLEALREQVRGELARHANLALVGDYNIAPTPDDTHDPAIWEGSILCSEPERAGFRALLELGLTDAYGCLPQAPGTFTWWDYRAAGFRRNLGLRIDHVLLSAPLAARVAEWQVDKTPRKAERPSDHAPVVVRLQPSAA